MTLDVLPAISRVPAADWDALVPADDPFSTHAFLDAMEQSGSAVGETGWTPCHLALREQGRLVAAMPLYAKPHSYGEYIFDWGWADAAQRSGLSWYPKLVTAVPFTPATGGRLLLGGPAVSGDPRIVALATGARQILKQIRGSSWHVLFCGEAERAALTDLGLIPRLTHQFHWENQGYESFDHWLSFFRHKERKQAKKERSLPPGVTVREAPGTELTDGQLKTIYSFYQDTVDRKGGYDYLSEAFFLGLNRGPVAGLVRVFLAEQAGEVVSASLCFQRGRGLYGRYWGCRPGHQGLHFELCYHAPIARCIAEGWSRFEAGAQGIHKLKRGLMPSPIWSAHEVVHPGLRRAIADACVREAAHTERQIAALAEHGPFKAESDPPG